MLTSHLPGSLELVRISKELDIDPAETGEWIDALRAVVDLDGSQRGRYIMAQLIDEARKRGALPMLPWVTNYVNTISVADTPEYPGDEVVERKIRRIIRWNAAAMVARANASGGLGGHISTYASAANLYEVGFNHFFHGPDGNGSGDQVFFQGHASPGIYARSFLEGRLTEEHLERFRREVERGRGLSSYPHPRLMPDYWQFPTVSMGLGPITAIYQARFNRYLAARGLKDTADSQVWCFVGDGETDEPESLCSLSIAARGGLDNLTFVVNCNLQRLDGPVRGNGNIIQELEAVFRGAGWNVIKLIWGRDWDPIFAADPDGVVVDALNHVVDGEWQKYASEPGSYTREKFFSQDPRMLAAVEAVSDEKILRLRRGGHDSVKIHAAFKAAVEHKGQPTVILAHTVKGWTLGEGFEARNVTHQMKKLSLDQLRRFRDRLDLPIADEHLAEAPFYHPGKNSEEVQYLLDRRDGLGGFLPKRAEIAADPIEAPDESAYEDLYLGTREGSSVSTTMAMVRLLAKLMQDKNCGKHVVPIVPDEARTFGMDPFFRQFGIYAAGGQHYEPIDRNMLLYYREANDGQLLEEGITEAGSMASCTAAGTAYSTHGVPMIPFFIFYSMFGFQRVGDSLWAFGDMRGRGFVLGATAGRTTLNGEGLQHQDGHSQLVATTVPSCHAYDPAFGYEIAIIVEEGIRRMFVENEDVFFYLTLQNENYDMPPLPQGVKEGVLKGLYKFKGALKRRKLKVQLFGSGSIINAVMAAQKILDEKYSVAAEIWSATSYQQLRRDALECERWNRLHPTEEPRVPWIAEQLDGLDMPVIAASDYIKTVPDQVSRWIRGRFVPLGTDGWGMSDTREALRRHFEVDAESIVIAALDALRQDGEIDGEVVAQAIKDLDFDTDKLDPMAV